MYNQRRLLWIGDSMGFRILLAFFSGLTSVITTTLAIVAFFGEENSVWVKRFLPAAAISAVVCLVSIFWGV